MIKKLIIIAVGALIFMGPPWYFEFWSLMAVTWLPALLAMWYLDDED